MKLIEQFEENDKIETPLMISQMTKGVSNNGAPYLSVTFQDKTGVIEAKVWDVKPEQAAMYQPGTIGVVRGEVLRYRNALQVKIISFAPVDAAKIKDMSRFVSTGDVAMSDLQTTLQKNIDTITHEPLKCIVEAILEDCRDAFFSYPAASRNHHDFVSGLATHVYGMLQLGNAVCDLYPQLNRDLMIAGIIMHDVGKTVELSGPMLTEYTMEGKLLGHISIMQAMLYDKAKDLQLEKEESIILLRHMVLSHHGAYEYGSPVLPLTPEAEMLSFIDNIDARMNMIDKTMQPTEPGMFAQRNFSLENRTFYKSKFDK